MEMGELESRILALEELVGKLRAEPLRLKPGDILALETDDRVSEEAARLIETNLQRFLPEGYKVLIFERIRPRVITPQVDAEGAPV